MAGTDDWKRGHIDGRCRVRAMTVAGLAVLLSMLLPAQTFAEPARVQLSRDRDFVRGNLLDLTQRIAVFEVSETAHVDTLQLANVYLVQSYSGRSIHAANAIAGTIILAVVGGIVGGHVEASTCRGDAYCGLGGFVIGAGIGIGVGIGIGLIPRADWKTLYASPEAEYDRRVRSGWNK